MGPETEMGPQSWYANSHQKPEEAKEEQSPLEPSEKSMALADF